MKRLCFCALMLFTVLAFVLFFNRKAPSANAQQSCSFTVDFIDGVFLKRSGMSFTYNGQPVCLYGSTIYNSNGPTAPVGKWYSTNYPPRIDWDLNLAQQAHLNVIRPTDQANDATLDPYNSQIWANMDYLVQQARLKHMFVLLDLSTFSNNLKKKGINPYDPAQATAWKDFITFVVTRYKDAPNISNYSLAGEVNPVYSTTFPTSTTQGYLDFFTRVTNDVYDAETAAGSGHHLIAAGGLSHVNDPNSGIPWQQIFGLPHVDMASIHVYPSNPLDPINTNNDLKISIPLVSQWAIQNNKPAMIEEYGFQAGIGDDVRASAMQTILQAAMNKSFTALIVWNLGPEVTNTTGYDVNPSLPAAWAQLTNGANVFYGQPLPTSTPIPKPGDANGDGKVDGIDFVIWLNHYGQNVTNGNISGDFNNDGKVDGADYTVWLNNF